MKPTSKKLFNNPFNQLKDINLLNSNGINFHQSKELELDQLIGLTSVKKEVSSLVDFIKVQKERKKIGK